MDYTISENFILPSLGRVYDQEVAAEVILRSMTTNDEMKRLSPSEYQYKLMSEVIDDCIVGGSNISSYDMCIGDYQFLLHKLRTVTYGSEVEVNTVCPYCNTKNTDTINIDDFKAKEFTEDILKYLEFELPISKKKVKIQMPTPRIMDRVSHKASERLRKSQNKNQDFSMLFLMICSIKEVDGKKVDEVKLEGWLRELPMKDTQYILAYISKVNALIGLDTSVTVICEGCGQEYDSTFRPGTRFFSPEVTI